MSLGVGVVGSRVTIKDQMTTDFARNVKGWVGAGVEVVATD